LFSDAKDLTEIRKGSYHMGAPNAGGYAEIVDFSQITRHNLKQLQGRHIVSIKVE